MTEISFNNKTSVLFSSNTARDIDIIGDNMTHKLSSNDGTHKFAIKDSNNTDLWSVTSDGTITPSSGSGNGDYFNAYYDAGNFNPVTVSGWDNIFTIETANTQSSGITKNAGTGKITLTGKCKVDYQVVVGDNSGGNNFYNIRMVLDGSTICNATTRCFNSMGFATLALSWVVPSGTELDLQINGANGTNKTILTSYNVCIHNI